MSPGALIVGGGPAGAAAATLIARAGQPVVLLERSPGPADKLCGDFLSGPALAILERLGTVPGALGGVALCRVRLAWRDRGAEAALPFPAMGLARRELDEALLHQAQQAGATVLRGEAVRRIEPASKGFAVHTANAGTLHAPTVFLATGKHDVRGLARQPRPNGLVGLKMYYRLSAVQSSALGDTIELLLLPRGYAGLQRVAPDQAVFCLLVQAAQYRMVGSWQALVGQLSAAAPLLESRLSGAVPLLPRPLAVAAIPYGHLYHTATAPGLFRIGDQACVVPSLAGDGVATALTSAGIASASWLEGRDSRHYHAALAGQARLPLRFAGLLHLACQLPALQPVIAGACRAWPGLLSLAASVTRIGNANVISAMNP